jgi:hypothetical protein
MKGRSSIGSKKDRLLARLSTPTLKKEFPLCFIAVGRMTLALIDGMQEETTCCASPESTLCILNAKEDKCRIRSTFSQTGKQ